MADSPVKNSDGPLTVTIKCNETALSSTYEIVSIEVENHANRIPTATIVFNDGDMPNARFPVSDEATLVPGVAITIEAGYNSKAETIFSGIIVKHAVRIGKNNASRLVIECRDKALAMTVARKSVSYVDKKDSELFTTLLRVNGLTPKVTETKTKHKELVQYHCSDWDFMVARAEANGMLVMVDGGTVTVNAPDTSTAPVLQLTYGSDIIDFHAEMDARSQYSTVKTMSWDPATQTLVSQTATPQTLTGQGNITAAKLAAVLNVSDVTLQSDAKLSSEVLSGWAKAQQLKSELARVRGHVSFQGSSKAKVGKLIELKGVGQRFNGKVWIAGVTHTIADGNWVTRADFGLSPTWFTEQHDLATPMAAGLTAGISGLHIGIVAQLDADPEGETRVQVKLPLFGSTGQLVWARLAKFYASNAFGAYFIPEINDEVILGFVNDDPTNPIILGSLYSSKNPPPYTPEKKNNTKAIVTRSKLRLVFDEEKKKITLVTPAKNTIVIDDDGKSILIEDETKNKIELNTSGITLESPKDIKISAKGKITIDAVGNVDVSSKADITEKAGMNVAHTANMAFTAKGSASAEVSASGTTTIKGALVMIN